jgi:2-keto-4-pentenoate hydratase
MKRFVLSALLLLAGPPASLLHAALPSSRAIDAFAEDYLAVRETKGFSQRLTMAEALTVQKMFVRQLQPKLGKPVGYKVGLVTREAQQRYGTDSPLHGVLLEKMLLQNDAVVRTNFAVRPVLEADLIAVVKDKGINKAQSVLEVAEHLKEVIAFIELPDTFVPTNPPPYAALLAAGNVGARLGVLGQRLPVGSTAEFVKSLGEMTARIIDQDGAELGRGQGKVILDHPLNAVLWLVEELRRSGTQLKAGELLSLGSIKAIPVPTGKSVTVRYDGLPGGPMLVSVQLQ